MHIDKIRKRLFDDYAAALKKGTAGMFVGAGLSMQAGYPSWRQLLRGIAKDLSLDVDVETDLIGLAQFHINAERRRRTRLAELIRDAFPDRAVPEVHRVIARLPISSIWTTNYDTLIERAFAEQYRPIDVKRRQDDLPLHQADALTTLYKMHGSVDDPSSVVIARDDYELYSLAWLGFTRLLEADYISKTLLFVGLSFEDPNLAYILAMIRAMLRDHTPTHYAIMRRPQRHDFEATDSLEERYAYSLNRFNLWTDDMTRYGISVVAVDSYDEVTDIIKDIEQRFASNTVFVSGSYDPEPGEEREKVERLGRAVGALIARANLKLVSGFGLTVGTAVIAGFVEQLFANGPYSLDRRMTLRPFPQTAPTGMTIDDFVDRYRTDIVSQAGTCVVIAGVKDGAVARGVLREAEIARRLGRAILPISGSGGAADELARELGGTGTASAQFVRDVAATEMDIDRVIDVLSRWLPGGA